MIGVRAWRQLGGVQQSWQESEFVRVAIARVVTGRGFRPERRSRLSSLLTGRLAFAGVVLDHRVHFGAEQQHGGGNIQI